MSDWNADAAAARAVGRQADDELRDREASADAGDEASSTTSSTTGDLADMLRSTTPDPPLEEVSSPWDPDRGGLTRVYRGLMKAVGLEGTPAAVDLVVGILEELVDRAEEGTDEDGEASPGYDARGFDDEREGLA